MIRYIKFYVIASNVIILDSRSYRLDALTVQQMNDMAAKMNKEFDKNWSVMYYEDYNAN